jgi:translation initiation factor 2B subunit (eIF-2B alpha/beta/delta family)
MHEITTKYVLLHKKLKNSQKTLFNCRLSCKEFKRYATKNKDKIKDLEKKRTKTTKQIQVIINKDNLARKRINKLKKKKGNLIQKH